MTKPRADDAELLRRIKTSWHFATCLPARVAATATTTQFIASITKLAQVNRDACRRKRVLALSLLRESP
jgi:hypothetical protein